MYKARGSSKVREAAEQGLASAQYNLAFLYRQGIGVNQDLVQMKDWLVKAASQNHAKAQYELGECYLHGWGVNADQEQAFKWLSEADARGEERVKQLIDENHLTNEFEKYKRDHFQPL